MDGGALVDDRMHDSPPAVPGGYLGRSDADPAPQGGSGARGQLLRTDYSF